MEAPWPDLRDADAFKVYWPRVLLIVLITAIFSILTTLTIPALVWASINNKLPAAVSGTELTAVISVLLLFDLGAIFGFIKSYQNYKNPFLRFIANQEGIYFNLLLSGKKAFFLSWGDIESIRIEQKMRRIADHETVLGVVSVYFRQSPQNALPNILSNAYNDAPNNLYFFSDTLDAPVDQIVKKLIEMKK